MGVRFMAAFEIIPDKPQKIPTEQTKSKLLQVKVTPRDHEQLEMHRLLLSDKYQRHLDNSEYLRRAISFFMAFGEHEEVMKRKKDLFVFIAKDLTK